jgi:hypothetical protein
MAHSSVLGELDEQAIAWHMLPTKERLNALI